MTAFITPWFLQKMPLENSITLEMVICPFKNFINCFKIYTKEDVLSTNFANKFSIILTLEKMKNLTFRSGLKHLDYVSLLIFWWELLKLNFQLKILRKNKSLKKKWPKKSQQIALLFLTSNILLLTKSLFNLFAETENIFFKKSRK